MISCVHCGKDISDAVSSKTAVYKVGKVHCPHCHKQNKRYLSEMDLHLVSMGNMLIYGIVLGIMSLMAKSFYSGNGNFLVNVLGTVVAFVIVIVGITQWGLIVYQFAPMKKEWMNYTMPEEEDEVTKKTKKTFKAFLWLVVALGVLAMYIGIWCYVVGVILYLVLMFIKLKQIQKKENTYFRSV